MPRILKELVFKAGEKNDGSAIWKKAGVLIETDHGKRVILLDRSFNPAGVMLDDPTSSACLLNLFDPQTEEEREARYKQHKAKTKNNAEKAAPAASASKKSFRNMDDDIPF